METALRNAGRARLGTRLKRIRLAGALACAALAACAGSAALFEADVAFDQGAPALAAHPAGSPSSEGWSYAGEPWMAWLAARDARLDLAHRSAYSSALLAIASKGAIEAAKLRHASWLRPKFKLPAASAAGDWYVFGDTTLAPAFHESSGNAFKPLTPDPSEKGGSGILRRLIAEHEKASPPGWPALVERVKAARAEGGEMAMAKAANALINETPYIDNTNGVYFTPKTFFERGGAVCKDYANVQYILLRDAGFPVEKMRIAALMPGAGSSYAWGHVVLLVNIEGASEPYVMDLPDNGSFAADLRTRGQSLAQRVAEIKRYGVGDHEPRLALANFVPLSRFNMTAYGGNRGLLGTSNEMGSTFFTMQKPKLGEPEWLASDNSTSAYRDAGGLWFVKHVQSGTARFDMYRRVSEKAFAGEAASVERQIKPSRAPLQPGSDGVGHG